MKRALAYSGPASQSLLEVFPLRRRRRFAEQLRALTDDPQPPGSVKMRLGKRRAKSGAVYRIRNGPYRALYVFNEKEVLILDIEHRKNAYRRT